MTKKKILLIEDDSDDQLFFTMALEETFPEMSCKTVKNGIEGMSALESGVDPSIIFLDLNMPVMNGYEFLENYTKVNCTAPVVVLTTSSDPGDIDKTSMLGAKGFMTKPVDFESFKRALLQVFRYDFNAAKNHIHVF